MKPHPKNPSTSTKISYAKPLKEAEKEVQKKSKSSNAYRYSLIALFAIAVGVWTQDLSDFNQYVPQSIRKLLQTNKPSITPKYESDLVKLVARKLLKPDTLSQCLEVQLHSEIVQLQEAMANERQMQQDNLVFLSLNGQNEGVYIRYIPTEPNSNDCLREIVSKAATVLGADTDYFVNGLRLMNSMGLPIQTMQELIDNNRIGYILLDFQIWVWPGIKVGYEREVDDVKMKTISLRPLVFAIEEFFNDSEADYIIKEGVDHLARSPVDSKDAVDGYHSDRTSYTAFLDDSAFTRDFRARTAKLARLPSASFVERLQLVRYEVGQFFRKHEDYFQSKEFIPQSTMAVDEYKDWTLWAQSKIAEFGDRVSPNFQVNGKLYPDFESKVDFQINLLELFIADAKEVNFFFDHADVDWGTWIVENVGNRATGIMEVLLGSKQYMLKHIIHSWEKRAQLPELKYKFRKQPVSAVSQYFRWIRWGKDMITNALPNVPENILPQGSDYPNFNFSFQNLLIKYILHDYSAEDIVAAIGQKWYDYMLTEVDSNDVLMEILRNEPQVLDLVLKVWTTRAGLEYNYTIPKELRHFEPNRFVTLFLYLNDVDEGGETVFPYSKERLVTNIERTGMKECSEGLAVPAKKLHASLFYAQTPENEVDPMSLHGGCPPAKGIKYGANSFAWNADADEGANAWDMGYDYKGN